MAIKILTNKLIFPKINNCDNRGIVAIGGDLLPDRLLLAYSKGIFPWFSENEPIIWWCPDPRFVLFPKDIKISSSMKKLLKKELFKTTIDTSFRDIITMCSKLRSGNTWITKEMIESYCTLHDSKHLESLGGVNIKRNHFMEILKNGLSYSTIKGKWT